MWHVSVIRMEEKKTDESQRWERRNEQGDAAGWLVNSIELILARCAVCRRGEQDCAWLESCGSRCLAADWIVWIRVPAEQTNSDMKVGNLKCSPLTCGSDNPADPADSAGWRDDVPAAGEQTAGTPHPAGLQLGVGPAAGGPGLPRPAAVRRRARWDQHKTDLIRLQGWGSATIFHSGIYLKVYI